MSAPSESRRSTGSRGPRPRYLLWSVLALVLVLASAVVWVGVRGLIAKQDLESSLAHVATLKEQLTEGRTDAARQTAGALERSASDARRKTSDPVWGLFEHVPFVGPNLRAVGQVAAIVDDVAHGAVRPAVDVAGSFDVSAFKPQGGKVDLQPLVAARPAVATADRTLREAVADGAAIDTSSTLSVVSEAVNRLRGALDSVAGQAATADRVVALAPDMLGTSGAKNYIVLFQNNAELRAGGGIPGAVALVTVDNGAITLGRQASTADLPQFDEPVLPLTTDTKGLYGSITGEYIQDVTLTPRFGVSAKLAREMWKQKFGQDVDGVLSIDPVTLGYILKATGPVQLATGDILTSENAVSLLLSDAYAKYPDPAQQDAFFASAASAVFSKVSEGGFDPRAFIDAIVSGVGQSRIKLWSADPQQQARLQGTPIAGDLPVSDSETQRFGVYLNDATGGKMDYYLEKSVAVGSEVCRKDGRPTWSVDVTLKSTAPADAGTGLSDYVTGAGNFGVAPGDVKTIVAVYAPPSGLFTGVTQDGKAAAPHSTKDGKYPVVQIPTMLAPGESTKLRFQFLGEASQKATAVDAVVTPGVRESAVDPIANGCSSRQG